MNLQHILNEHSKWLNGEGGERADLCGADLRRADLSGVDLRGANLRHADLRHADLRGADLSDADLRDADLRDADLRHANLGGANLQFVSLSDADLSDADLCHVDLRDADLSDVDLRGVDLWGTTGNMREVKSLQLEQYPVTYTATRLQIGCENHPIEQWWGFSESEIYDMDGQKAVDFWHKYKELIKEVIKTSPAVDTLVK